MDAEHKEIRMDFLRFISEVAEEVGIEPDSADDAAWNAFYDRPWAEITADVLAALKDRLYFMPSYAIEVEGHADSPIYDVRETIMNISRGHYDTSEKAIERVRDLRARKA